MHPGISPAPKPLKAAFPAGAMWPTLPTAGKTPSGIPPGRAMPICSSICRMSKPLAVCAICQGQTGSTNGDITEYEISVGMDPDTSACSQIRNLDYAQGMERYAVHTGLRPLCPTARHSRYRRIWQCGRSSHSCSRRRRNCPLYGQFTNRDGKKPVRCLKAICLLSITNRVRRHALETAVEAGWAALRDYQSQEAIDDAADAIHSLLLDLRKLPDPDTLPE